MKMMGFHRGEWRPLYVPEWYSPRVSQYFFDPYSFTHILHGFFFFLTVGWWPTLVWEYTWWWVWVVGPTISLALEMLHEVVENSEFVIRMYRDSSGTSELYKGDSVQNVVGDLISSTFGYYVAAVSVFTGNWWVVPVWTFISETALIMYMRDSLFLTIFQLAFKNEKIRRWQGEIIPESGKRQDKIKQEKSK